MVDDEKQPLLVVGAPHGYGPATNADDDGFSQNCEPSCSSPTVKPWWEISAILSTAFAYGCILTTLFMITLPVECERINKGDSGIPKSVALGCFVAVAGTVQLVSPLIGTLSDTYRPPADVGQRLPYLVLGAIFTVVGLIGQIFSSDRALWIRYGFSFFLHMIGLMIVYTMMIALIPDQIPEAQTGMANGTLALLLVTGSLFGFGLFHSIFTEKLWDMYGLYICIIIFTSVLTCIYGHPGDVAHAGRLRPDRRETPASPDAALSPSLLFRTMIYDPLADMDWRMLRESYTIDMSNFHDFFVVTVSRTFYYMGISVQTFFLYFLHDVIGVRDNPEAAVATLAILGQCAGAATCYPVGVISDTCCGGRRKPFVYLSCTMLLLATLSLIICRSLSDVAIAVFVLGAANGVYLTMDTSLAVDSLPREEGGGSGHAQLLGIWGVAGFIGSALGPLIGGPLLYVIGSEHDGLSDEEQYSRWGYSVVFALSATSFFLSAITLKFMKNENV